MASRSWPRSAQYVRPRSREERTLRFFLRHKLRLLSHTHTTPAPDTVIPLLPSTGRADVSVLLLLVERRYSFSTSGNCQANPNFVPIASGGNGDNIQFCGYFIFAEFSASEIWFDQGTSDTTPTRTLSSLDTRARILRRCECPWQKCHRLVADRRLRVDSVAILTDADFIPVPLSNSLFPGIPSNVLAHMGFAGSQSRWLFHVILYLKYRPYSVFRSAAPVLAAVKKTLATYNTTTVTVTGHSLGASPTFPPRSGCL